MFPSTEILFFAVFTFDNTAVVNFLKLIMGFMKLVVDYLNVFCAHAMCSNWSDNIHCKFGHFGFFNAIYLRDILIIFWSFDSSISCLVWSYNFCPISCLKYWGIFTGASPRFRTFENNTTTKSQPLKWFNEKSWFFLLQY